MIPVVGLDPSLRAGGGSLMDPYLLFLVSIASAGVLFLVFQAIEDHKRRKRRRRRK